MNSSRTENRKKAAKQLTTHEKQLLGASLMLFVALLFTYVNHWNNGFHFDDSHTIEENIYIRRLANIPLFYKDVTTFSTLNTNRSYRPVVSTVLAFSYWMGEKFSGNGYTPYWYHLPIFLFFLAQGALMFFFFRKILGQLVAEEIAGWVSLAAVAFYMMHPALAETINYIIAQSDSISTFWLILGFVLYQYSPMARRTCLFLVPVVIGCLAKPTALMFAPMLVVYYMLFEEKKSLYDLQGIRKVLANWRIPLSFVVMAAIYVFQRKMEVGNFDPGGRSLFNYAITQPFVMLHYVGEFFLPLQLSADTDWEPFTSLWGAECIVGFLFLFATIAGTFYLSKFANWRPVAFGFAWFLLALLPTSLVPLAEVTNDHRVFFPYVGLSLALIWTIYMFSKQALARVPMQAIMLGAMLVLAAYGYGTHRRNAVWLNEETLWKDVTIKSPHNSRGQMNYGYVFLQRGAFDTANVYLTEAYRLAPRYPYIHWNMAVLKDNLGDAKSAEQFFWSAMTLMPENGGLYCDYAYFLRKHERYDEAIANFKKGLALLEARIDARQALMELLYKRGRFDELKPIAKRTLELVPGDETSMKYLQLVETGQTPLQLEEKKSASYTTPDQWLALSLMYYQNGNYAKCVEAAQNALKLKPNYPEAYINICAANNSLGKFEEGRIAGEMAVKLSPENALAKNNLAWSVRELAKK